MADDRITFRPGGSRAFKIALYKKKQEERTGKEPNNTVIMHKALDMFLGSAQDGSENKIREYEDIIIKLMLGFNRKNCRSDNEYLDKLNTAIEDIKSVLSSE